MDPLRHSYGEAGGAATTLVGSLPNHHDELGDTGRVSSYSDALVIGTVTGVSKGIGVSWRDDQDYTVVGFDDAPADSRTAVVTMTGATPVKTGMPTPRHDGGMTVAADTFAEFVDGLAAALDDHDATGEDWASRHHFSRFHFDRMIKSVGGEPPQTLRRRILLERAAYRMITTKVPLLDIAIEAGYSSHEAFTRAFTKAYDMAPREWRKKPGHIQIGEANGVHFVPPGSIRLPSRDVVRGADLLERMVEHHVWLTGELIRVAGALTDEELDETVVVEDEDDGQSIRSLLSRLVGQMGMWNAAMATRDYDWSVEEHESTTSMRRRLGIEGPRYLAHVREVCDQGRIEDTFVDALCERAEVFTYGGMIAHVLTFAAYRRTVVVLALARLGHDELGWGDPMRWVADGG